MNASSRTARQIIKSRRQANKAHKAGLHTLKSHCLKAGLDAELAGGIAGALRSKAKAIGVTGCQAHMMRRTLDSSVPVRGARRYSKDEFLSVAHAYAPRLKKYVDARATLLAY